MTMRVSIRRIDRCTARWTPVRFALLLMMVAALLGHPTAQAAAPDVKVSFESNGELQITLDGKLITPTGEAPEPKAKGKKASPTDTTLVRFREPEAKVPLWGVDDKMWPVDKADNKPTGSSFDASKRTLTQTFPWGQVIRNYRVHPDGGVDIEVTVHNKSPRALFEFHQQLVMLKLPADTGPAITNEALYFGQAAPAQGGEILSGPVALPLVGGAGYGDGRGRSSRAIVATTPETTRQMGLRWDTDTWLAPWNRKKPAGYAANDPVAMDLAAREEQERAANGETWWLTLRIGGDRLLYHDRYASRPIPPGGSDTYAVWLRFGDASDPLAPAREALQLYAKAHPMHFKWTDRRPIVVSMFGDALPFRPPTGPSMEKPTDVSPSESVRALMMKEADRLITEAKTINAQGVIIWNIEGNSPAYLKYVGDPRVVEVSSPETDAVADEFFKKLRDAGLKVGVCLRPSVIAIKPAKKISAAEANESGADKNEYVFFHDYPHPKRPPEDVLADKVAYAKNRWGCTLFYVDTNDAAGWWPKTDEEKVIWPKESDGKLKWYHALLNETVWEKVLQRHPDVLFTIEHTPLIQYTVSAPYDEWMTPLDGTAAVVRATWPEAFKCLVIKEPKDFWRVVARVEAGDVLIGEAAFVQRAQFAAEYLRQGPPPELSGKNPAELLSLAIDAKSDGRLRFFAAKQLGRDSSLDAGIVTNLLYAKDALVQLVTLDSLDTPRRLWPQIGQLVRLMGGRGQYSFFAGGVRDAMRRAGPEFQVELLEYAKANPKEALGVMDICFVSQGTASTQAMADYLSDESQPMNIRIGVAGKLGWRKDATPKQKDEALALLLPLLKDTKLRKGAAETLHPRYVWQHGLWSNDKRVLEAATAAATAERAQPSPDAAYLATLDKIIKRQQ